MTEFVLPTEAAQHFFIRRRLGFLFAFASKKYAELAPARAVVGGEIGYCHPHRNRSLPSSPRNNTQREHCSETYSTLRNVQPGARSVYETKPVGLLCPRLAHAKFRIGRSRPSIKGLAGRYLEEHYGRKPSLRAKIGRYM